MVTTVSIVTLVTIVVIIIVTGSYYGDYGNYYMVTMVTVVTVVTMVTVINNQMMVDLLSADYWSRFDYPLFTLQNGLGAVITSSQWNDYYALRQG